MLSTTSLLGAAIVGLPLILIAALLLWNRNRAVFYFAFAAILVGVGYLMATGAASDVALMFDRDLPAAPTSAPANDPSY